VSNVLLLEGEGALRADAHADAAFPHQDYSGSLYVVNSALASNGIGGTFTRSFHYYGAHLHLQGRGFLGFAARYDHDSRNGVYAYEYFQRTFPYTGTPTQRDSKFAPTLFHRIGSLRFFRNPSLRVRAAGASPSNCSL
jgi:hypothetical protein